ncbi:MAG: hypothetical protein M1457_07005 [bacterium]|nr:hypothetical protein [bacterium]
MNERRDARGGREAAAIRLRTGASILALTATLGAAGRAAAQAVTAAGEVGSRWFGIPIGPNWLMLFGAVLVVALVAAAWIIYQRSDFPRVTSSEGETRSTRFEQLNAEMQGLALRLESGESRGYYKKIGMLGRVFLERIGVAGARAMTDEQVEKILRSGQLTQDQAGTLASIFARCREGALHESEKLDYTAADILKDLRRLVREFEEATPSQSHS